VLDLGSRAADDAASVHAAAERLRTQFKRHPTFFAFYVGSSDPTFVGENEQLNRELNAARVPHLFELYRGGHTVSLWRAHAVGWFALALRRLSAAK
jgi:enterochelin esterase-like enzyme